MTSEVLRVNKRGRSREGTEPGELERENSIFFSEDFFDGEGEQWGIYFYYPIIFPILEGVSAGVEHVRVLKCSLFIHFQLFN